jgi:hypothetical protein
MAEAGRTDAETGVKLDAGKRVVAWISPLLGLTAQASAGAAVACCGRLRLHW